MSSAPNRGGDDAKRDADGYSQAIFDAVNDPIAVIDVNDFRVVDANPAFIASCGIPREKVIGQTCHALTHGLDHPCEGANEICPVRELLASRRPAVCEHVHTTPTGERRTVSIGVSPLRGANGEITRVVHIARDITAYKDGQRALATAEARYRELVENSHDIIYSGVVDGEAALPLITYACPQAETTLGISPSELTDAPHLWWTLIHDDDKARAEAEITAALASGKPVTRELRINTRQNGDYQWFEDTFVPKLDESRRAIGFLGVARDISTRKRMEAQFHQAQKMEAIGLLAGGVAHDFNNLLSVILANSSFALDSLPPENPARADVLEIKQAGERAASLTKQLLAFSRKQVVQPREMNPNDAVNSLAKMLRRLIGENIALDLKLAPNARAVMIDPVQFDQVITNLAVNARDAMPSGGRLVIETNDVVLTDDDVRSFPDVMAGSYVAVRLSDTGTGIPRDVLPRIFEPFFTTKERGKGTGLGLSMVYGAVKQNGGHISVLSEVGAGTSFTVFLRAVQTSSERGATASGPESVRGHGETVMVVEDDASVRTAIVRILREAGYAVLDAASGDEALARIAGATKPPAVVITDLVMPGMNGVALAEQIAARHPETRVVFCSGYADVGILPDYAIAKLVMKPIERPLLLQAIHAAIA
ncbi:MAG: PAS domain S-box protein [Deltaproteobacteria bacterium]|nr:PAS domain S-box protein [Deltaproteobacteria bacterium]